MPDLSVKTSLAQSFIRIALIIQVQNQEKSMRLITNMRLLTRVYGIKNSLSYLAVCG